MSVNYAFAFETICGMFPIYSTGELEMMKNRIEDIIRERDSDQNKKIILKAEEKLFLKMKGLLEDLQNKSDEPDELSHITTIKDVYEYLIEESEKYVYVNVIEEFKDGDITYLGVPACYSERNCYWRQHRENVHEFDGSMYYMLFSGKDYRKNYEPLYLCDKCYEDDCGGLATPIDDFDFEKIAYFFNK